MNLKANTIDSELRKARLIARLKAMDSAVPSEDRPSRPDPSNPPTRHILGTIPNHGRFAFFFRAMIQMCMEVVEAGTGDSSMTPGAEAALTDLLDALACFPQILSGRTSIKVDSHTTGCFTILRNHLNLWTIYVVERVDNGALQDLGQNGYVLNIPFNSKPPVFVGKDALRAVEVIKRTLQAPDVRVRGSLS